MDPVKNIGQNDYLHEFKKKTDKITKYIPLLNSARGAIRIFIKCVILSIAKMTGHKTDLKKYHLVRKIEKENILKTVSLSIPVLGAFIAIILKIKKNL